MTERLTDLMHRAVDDLRVPPAPTQRVVDQGRAVRRARRRGAAGVLAAVVVVAGVGAGATWRGTSEVGPARPDDAGKAVQLSGSGPVLAVGSTVVLDGGDVVARVDGTVRGLLYTSTGVVVRYGAAPERLALVAADGTQRELPTLPAGVVPATDVDLPYLAYAEAGSGSTEVVVVDVRDDSEVARVAVPGTTGSLPAPPRVGLDGDVVYVEGGDDVRAVTWETGEVDQAPQVQDVTTVRGGRTILSQGGTRSVVDVGTGELRGLTIGPSGTLSLSPDGRYAVFGERLVELDTQTPVRLGFRGPVGWSPSDQPFVVDGDRLTTCSPKTGDCVETRLDVPGTGSDAVLRLGGETAGS